MRRGRCFQICCCSSTHFAHNNCSLNIFLHMFMHRSTIRVVVVLVLKIEIEINLWNLFTSRRNHTQSLTQFLSLSYCFNKLVCVCVVTLMISLHINTCTLITVHSFTQSHPFFLSVCLTLVVECVLIDSFSFLNHCPIDDKSPFKH